MSLLFTLLTLAVIGVVAAVAFGRISGGLGDAASSLPARGLPTAGVEPTDLQDLRFSPALRGYRMAEVDVVLDRLAEELRARDEQIAQLREQLDGYRPLRGAQDYDEQPYPQSGYPTQGYSTQGYPTQGYSTQGYPTQGSPSRGYPTRNDDGAPDYPTQGQRAQGWTE